MRNPLRAGAFAVCAYANFENGAVFGARSAAPHCGFFVAKRAIRAAIGFCRPHFDRFDAGSGALARQN